MSFLHKRLGRGDGLFGADLRDLRESRDIPLTQAAEETRIRITLLQAFEEDQLEELGDPAFSERHLLAYVRYLGGHEPYFTARYRASVRALNKERQVAELLPRTRNVRMRDLLSGPQLFAAAGILLFSIAVGGYVLYQARTVQIPPPLTIHAPEEGAVLEGSTVQVVGQTMPEAFVTINGRSAAVDPQGHFQLSIDVRRGTTPITIVARRRRGSETSIVRNVVYGDALLETPVFPSATSTTSTE